MSPLNKNLDLHSPRISTIFAENSLTEAEFRKTCFSLEPRKTAGYDNIHVISARNL